MLVSGYSTDILTPVYFAICDSHFISYQFLESENHDIFSSQHTIYYKSLK